MSWGTMSPASIVCDDCAEEVREINSERRPYHQVAAVRQYDLLRSLQRADLGTKDYGPLGFGWAAIHFYCGK